MTRCWKCGHDESTIHFNGQNCPKDGVVSVHEFLCRDECEHGSLRRSCEICERDKEIAALKKQLEDRECCGNCENFGYCKTDGHIYCEADVYPFPIKGRCDKWASDGLTREERKWLYL